MRTTTSITTTASSQILAACVRVDAMKLVGGERLDAKPETGRYQRSTGCEMGSWRQMSKSLNQGSSFATVNPIHTSPQTRARSVSA